MNRKRNEAKLEYILQQKPELKEHLLAQPKEVVEKALEVSFPGKVKVEVLRETKDTVYLILPHKAHSVYLGPAIDEMPKLGESGKYHRRDVDAAIVNHALTNKDYRARLLSDPMNAAAEVVGKTLANKLKKILTLKVLEETPKLVYFCLNFSGRGKDLNIPKRLQKPKTNPVS